MGFKSPGQTQYIAGYNRGYNDFDTLNTEIDKITPLNNYGKGAANAKSYYEVTKDGEPGYCRVYYFA